MQSGVKERYDHFSITYCLNGGNGADAYRTAYPKTNSGHAQSANKLLSIPYVKKKIKAILADLAAKTEVTLEEVVKNARLQVSIGKVRGSASDIRGGNDQLGRIAGVYIEKTQDVPAEQASLTAEQEVQAAVMAELALRYGAEIKAEIERRKLKRA